MKGLEATLDAARSAASAVRGGAVGFYRLHPLAANVCRVTVCFRAQLRGQVPKLVIDMRVKNTLGIVELMRDKYERSGKAVDAERNRWVARLSEVEEQAANSARKADLEASRLIEQAETRCGRLRDEYEVKLKCHDLLTVLSAKEPSLVLGVLDSMIGPMTKTLSKRSTPNSVRQEIDRNEDMLRSALRAIHAMDSIEGSDNVASFKNFTNAICADQFLGPRFASVKNQVSE